MFAKTRIAVRRGMLVLAMSSSVAFADDTPTKPANGAQPANPSAKPNGAIAKPANPAALEHLSRGSKLYSVRKFEEAAAEYTAGALVETAAIFDYNLGQCYRQLGRYKDAIWHYQRFVKASPHTTDHVAAVQKFIEQMQAELDKKAMTAPPTEAASTATVPPDSVQTPGPAPTPDVYERAPWYSDRLGLGLAAVGIVGLGVGTAFLVSARSLNDDAEATASQQERNELFDRADSRATIGAIAMIGGGAVLVAGVVVLLIPNERLATRRETVGFGFTQRGIAVYGRF